MSKVSYKMARQVGCCLLGADDQSNEHHRNYFSTIHEAPGNDVSVKRQNFSSAGRQQII